MADLTITLKLEKETVETLTLGINAIVTALEQIARNTGSAPLPAPSVHSPEDPAAIVKALRDAYPDTAQAAEMRPTTSEENPAPITHPNDDDLPWKEDAPAPAAVPVEPKKPSVTRDDIRKAVVRINAAGPEKKSAVRAIITKHAKSVTDLPEDSFDEVFAALTELEG